MDIDINALIAAGAGIASIFKSVTSGIAELQTTKDKKRQQEIAARLNSEIIALQTALIAIQEEQIRTHEEIIHLKDWSKEKARYRLQVFQPSTPVYVITQEHQGDEAPHYICANCHSKNEKGFLHITKRTITHTHYSCARCKEVYTPDAYQPPQSPKSDTLPDN